MGDGADAERLRQPTGQQVDISYGDGLDTAAAEVFGNVGDKEFVIFLATVAQGTFGIVIDNVLPFLQQFGDGDIAGGGRLALLDLGDESGLVGSGILSGLLSRHTGPLPPHHYIIERLPFDVLAFNYRALQ